ncbi:Uncharacterized protein LSUE1_G000083 [Lachnellula suecica]|uniref:N-acetyltransferase domain-containing protein n=1 Tax=Lachnellula suecica TaxID=602035 RepID=A0A8T9CP50_9HELO|nr:Uncharacterized protein LSUE1_G000083 [Lachnellula suecica]
MFDGLGEPVTNTDPAHLPGPEPLVGKYVRLERLEEHHFPDLWTNIGAPEHAELWKWWPNGPFATPAEFNTNLNRLKSSSPDLAIYAVIPASGHASGLAAAVCTSPATHRVAELGLFFGPPLLRSRAGTEVVYLLANLMFKLNHRRLQWKTNALNLPSRKAAERYGFKFEGVMRQHQVDKGRNRDSAWYSILDCEWGVVGRAFEVWLEEGNFDEGGWQKKRLEEIREEIRLELV